MQAADVGLGWSSERTPRCGLISRYIYLSGGKVWTMGLSCITARCNGRP